MVTASSRAIARKISKPAKLDERSEIQQREFRNQKIEESETGVKTGRPHKQAPKTIQENNDRRTGAFNYDLRYNF